jgi:hypothetical protein
MRMRLVFARRARPKSTINPSHQIAFEQFNALGDARRNGTRQQQQTRQHALHQAGRIAAVADTIRALLHATGTVTEQSAQVVGHHFGGDVNDTGLLAQAADAFNFQAVLEAFEGFFDAPALVVQLPKHLCRKRPCIQVGEQHAHLAAGADTTHQAHVWGLANELVIPGIFSAGHVQGDHRLAGTAAQELAHRLEAAVTVTAHAKVDALLLQQGDQPSGRIAPPDCPGQAPAHHWLAGGADSQRASDARPSRVRRAGHADTAQGRADTGQTSADRAGLQVAFGGTHGWRA